MTTDLTTKTVAELRRIIDNGPVNWTPEHAEAIKELTRRADGYELACGDRDSARLERDNMEAMRDESRILHRAASQLHANYAALADKRGNEIADLKAELAKQVKWSAGLKCELDIANTRLLNERQDHETTRAERDTLDDRRRQVAELQQLLDDMTKRRDGLDFGWQKALKDRAECEEECKALRKAAAANERLREAAKKVEGSRQWHPTSMATSAWRVLDCDMRDLRDALAAAPPAEPKPSAEAAEEPVGIAAWMNGHVYGGHVCGKCGRHYKWWQIVPCDGAQQPPPAKEPVLGDLVQEELDRWFAQRPTAGRCIDTDPAKVRAHALSVFEHAVMHRSAAPEGPILAEARRRVAAARDAVLEQQPPPAPSDGGELSLLRGQVRRFADELDKLKAAVLPERDRDHPKGQLSNESTTDFAVRLIGELRASANASMRSAKPESHDVLRKLDRYIADMQKRAKDVEPPKDAASAIVMALGYVRGTIAIELAGGKLPTKPAGECVTNDTHAEHIAMRKALTTLSRELGHPALEWRDPQSNEDALVAYALGEIERHRGRADYLDKLLSDAEGECKTLRASANAKAVEELRALRFTMVSWRAAVMDLTPGAGNRADAIFDVIHAIDMRLGALEAPKPAEPEKPASLGDATQNDKDREEWAAILPRLDAIGFIDTTDQDSASVKMQGENVKVLRDAVRILARKAGLA